MQKATNEMFAPKKKIQNVNEVPHRTASLKEKVQQGIMDIAKARAAKNKKKDSIVSSDGEGIHYSFWT